MSADEGAKVNLRAVAFRDDEMVLGDDLEKVKVEAKVVGPRARREDPASSSTAAKQDATASARAIAPS